MKVIRDHNSAIQPAVIIIEEIFKLPIVLTCAYIMNNLISCEVFYAADCFCAKYINFIATKKQLRFKCC